MSRWVMVVESNIDDRQLTLMGSSIPNLSLEYTKKTNKQMEVNTLRNIYWKRTNNPYISIYKKSH